MHACVMLSSRSTYDYNLRQFTIDSLLAAPRLIISIGNSMVSWRFGEHFHWRSFPGFVISHFKKLINNS